MLTMRGFSLVEYMVGIAVTSILLGAAVPSLVDMVQDNGIRAIADQYRDGLSRARMEAVQRNRLVEFDANGSGWSIQLQSTATVIESRTGLNTESRYVITPSATAVTFASNGRSTPSSYTVDITVNGATCEAAGGTARCLRIVVGSGGSIRTCDPAVASTDPRTCS